MWFWEISSKESYKLFLSCFSKYGHFWAGIIHKSLYLVVTMSSNYNELEECDTHKMRGRDGVDIIRLKVKIDRYSP